MLDWEQTLETLRRRGWGYGYGRCYDAQTGEDIYLVNLSRGKETEYQKAQHRGGRDRYQPTGPGRVLI